MELYRLNADMRIPEEVVNSYSSLIWTERYAEAGEFKLTAGNIGEIRQQLPLGSFVSHADTAEIFVTESHAITYDDNTNAPKLEVSGRSFETILEDRVMANSMASGLTPRTLQFGGESPAMVAMTIIADRIGSTAGRIDEGDVIRFLNVVRSANVYNPPSGFGYSYPLEVKDAYSLVLEYLNQAQAGVRNKRRLGYVDPVTGPNNTDPRTNSITVEVYRGIDRALTPIDTANQGTPAVFSLDRGDIDKPSYLFSIKDFKNTAYVFSPIGSMIVYAPGTEPTPGYSVVGGMDRKVLFVNADDLQPVSGATNASLITQRGQLELRKYNQTMFFDGTVNLNSAPKYKVDYDLGDRVTLLGDYGIQETMIVSEYIRTEDQDGDRGYPTLKLSDDNL